MAGVASTTSHTTSQDNALSVAPLLFNPLTGCSEGVLFETDATRRHSGLRFHNNAAGTGKMAPLWGGAHHTASGDSWDGLEGGARAGGAAHREANPHIQLMMDRKSLDLRALSISGIRGAPSAVDGSRGPLNMVALRESHQRGAGYMADTASFRNSTTPNLVVDEPTLDLKPYSTPKLECNTTVYERQFAAYQETMDKREQQRQDLEELAAATDVQASDSPLQRRHKDSLSTDKHEQLIGRLFHGKIENGGEKIYHKKKSRTELAEIRREREEVEVKKVGSLHRGVKLNPKQAENLVGRLYPAKSMEEKKRKEGEAAKKEQRRRQRAARRRPTTSKDEGPSMLARYLDDEDEPASLLMAKRLIGAVGGEMFSPKVNSPLTRSQRRASLACERLSAQANDSMAKRKALASTTVISSPGKSPPPRAVVTKMRRTKTSQATLESDAVTSPWESTDHAISVGDGGLVERLKSHEGGGIESISEAIPPASLQRQAGAGKTRSVEERRAAQARLTAAPKAAAESRTAAAGAPKERSLSGGKGRQIKGGVRTPAQEERLARLSQPGRLKREPAPEPEPEPEPPVTVGSRRVARRTGVALSLQVRKEVFLLSGWGSSSARLLGRYSEAWAVRVPRPYRVVLVLVQLYPRRHSGDVSDADGEREPFLSSLSCDLGRACGM
jgi:hypothetical protein